MRKQSLPDVGCVADVDFVIFFRIQNVGGKHFDFFKKNFGKQKSSDLSKLSIRAVNL